MNELELEVYLKENINKMESYLLKVGKIEIDKLGNVKNVLKHFHDDEVEIYNDLAVIKAGYSKRKLRIFKDVQYQFTEDNICGLVSKFNKIVSSII